MNLDKTLACLARYYPNLFQCRVQLLQEMFCSSCCTWRNGRIHYGKNTRESQWERDYQDTVESRRRARSTYLARYREDLKLRPRAEMTEQERLTEQHLHNLKLQHTRKPKKATDREVLRVLRDDWNPYKEADPHDAPYSRFDWKRGGVSCVPDSVRPEYLVAIRELLKMALQWDTALGIDMATAYQQSLEARFGPMATWQDWKPIPEPLKVPEPEPDRTIVGRVVRVAMPDERFWGEHRPDLGETVYRVLNDTLSTLKAEFPEGHEDHSKKGKKLRLVWGTLVQATEAEYGCIVPKRIIGYDQTPREEDELTEETNG